MTPSMDLDYPDPAPSVDLAAVARGDGRRLRHRRRSAAVASAAGLVAAVAVVLPRTSSVDAPPTGPAVSPAPSAVRTQALPTAVGTGPGIGRFTARGYTPGQVVPGSLPPWQQTPAWGSPYRATSHDGSTAYVFTTKNGFLCTGDVEGTDTHVGPTSCQPLRRLPAAGLWGVDRWNVHGRTKALTDTFIVHGLVRGRVDRVVVRTPYGDVRASLAVARTPGLGTLFWASTPLTLLDDRGWSRTQVVAYRDGRPAFACTGDSCRAR